MLVPSAQVPDYYRRYFRGYTGISKGEMRDPIHDNGRRGGLTAGCY